MALVRMLALVSLGLACPEGFAQGLTNPASEVVRQEASPTLMASPDDVPADLAPGERATMPQTGPEPDPGAIQSLDQEEVVRPEPHRHRPGRFLQWLPFLWKAFLLVADPQAAACQPFPLPGLPLPVPMPQLPPLFAAPQAPTLVVPSAFQWLPSQARQPFNASDQAGAEATLTQALDQILRMPLPTGNVSQLLANLTGTLVPPTGPPSMPSNASGNPGTDPDPGTSTDLEAAATALAQTAGFVHENILVPGAQGEPGSSSSAQILAQLASLEGQLNSALALRAPGLVNASDTKTNALWDALAAFSGIAAGAIATPTELNNAALVAATASEIDETITNFMNVILIADLRLPATERNLERFANFSTSNGISPDNSGIGPPSIQADRPECLNCTGSCSFEQNCYQYATAVHGEAASTINLLAYAYFFIKGVELAALDTAMVANATSQLVSNNTNCPSMGKSPLARRLLQLQGLAWPNATEGQGSEPMATSAPPSAPGLQFPAPLSRYVSLPNADLPPMLPLDTVSVQAVMNRLGMTGATRYDPGCSQCCYLEVTKPLLAAARLSVLTAWLNAIGAGLFGLRVDLALAAYLETVAPPQRPALQAGLQANASQSFNAFFEGATPPPPASGDPHAPSDLRVLQATLAQVAKAVGADGAPPTSDQFSGILGMAMRNRLTARPGTNTNLTDTCWYGLQVLTNLTTRMPSAVTVKLVTGSLNLAQQWLGDVGYLFRLLSNAVGIEAQQMALARTTKVLVAFANNETTSSVHQAPGDLRCQSDPCVEVCNKLNFDIQYDASRIRFVTAQIGGVAYILAITANFINLGVDANQIINALIAQLNAAPPANMTANRLNGVSLGTRSQVQSNPAAAPPTTEAALAALIAPMDASLASAMNLTQVIALPQAWLSANTSSGLPGEDQGLPGVSERFQQDLLADNLTQSCLTCCNIENSVAILAIDEASLLSSQFVMSGYVLTDIAAGIRVGIQAITDISLLSTLVKASNATPSATTRATP